MATTDLDTIIDRVEALLTDSGNADWSTAELTQAIRLALSELSTLLPARAVTTIDAVDGQYEYSLSSITGLVCVTEVWYPYLSTDDSYKLPHAVKWRMLDDVTLFLDVDDDPDAQYKIRLFYDQVQTLEGLDGATATTLNNAEKSVLVLGAAGYAALAKGRDLMNEVTIGSDVPQGYMDWGKARLSEFGQRVYGLSGLDVESEDSRIGWWSADKWDE